jgi:hypothetical protein
LRARSDASVVASITALDGDRIEPSSRNASAMTSPPPAIA